MYKKGGHINFPIVYKNDDVKENLKCIEFPQVKKMEEINEFFIKLEKSKGDKKDIKYNEIYGQLFPFYYFVRFIKENCFDKADVKFLLNDVSGNFILTYPLSIKNGDEINFIRHC